MRKMPKIYDFKDIRRINEIENLLDDLEAFVREGDYIGLDNVIMSLMSKSAWSVDHLLSRLQKYYILGDDQMINAYRDVLVQIGSAAIPELIAFYKKSLNKKIFIEIASEIYISEMIDNYFAWRDHDLTEDSYYMRQYRLVDKIVQLGSPIVPQLVRNLMNVNIREYLIIALGKIGDRRATRVLTAFLRESQSIGFERVQPFTQKLLHALGEIGDQRAVRPMLRFLESDSVVEKSDVAEAIEKILRTNFGDYKSFGKNKRSWQAYQRRVIDYLKSQEPGSRQMQLVHGNLS